MGTRGARSLYPPCTCALLLIVCTSYSYSILLTLFLIVGMNESTVLVCALSQGAAANRYLIALATSLTPCMFEAFLIRISHAFKHCVGLLEYMLCICGKCVGGRLSAAAVCVNPLTAWARVWCAVFAHYCVLFLTIIILYG